MTGPNAKTTFDGMMTLFGLETVYSNELNVYTNSAYFKNEGTSTMTFGTVSFPVTTYGLNSPNETFSECGITDTITAYTLQVGTPPGTSLEFITYMNFSGISNGSSANFTFKLVSMTVSS
jgi:hypothetical protein